MNQDDVPEQWVVERIVPGGEGFVRLPSGFAAFVPGGLPGDRIRALRVERRKGYLRAVEWELLEAGPERVTPPCRFAHRCGGCDFMALTALGQQRAKVGMLREAMSRTGGFENLPSLPEVRSAGPALGYRTRLRLHIDARGKIGLFARGSHELIELDECIVCHERVNAELGVLRELSETEPGSFAQFSEVEIRVGEAEDRAVLFFVPRSLQRRISSAASALLDRLRARFRVSIAGSHERSELSRMTLPGGLELRTPAASFAQVNWSVNRVLVQRVVELAALHEVQSFIELYAGAGNFTLPLLVGGRRGTAIEGNAAAAAALRDSARRMRYELVVLTGDVRERFAELRRSAQSADLVFLDPPRAGAKGVLAEIIELGPAHVGFCSCDPVTLARDLRTLSAAGYALRVFEGFDMFPQTHHVEALAWLTRASG
ncbi:MAG TPA: RsmD family RNA methyltransferase [Polyangiaceae bacterium]|nr:RsmD family RNA methyltransferase [Polyangiaceae bacterium]